MRHRRFSIFWWAAGIVLLVLGVLTLVPILCSLAAGPSPAAANERVNYASVAPRMEATGLQVAPASLQVSQRIGVVATRTLTLTNTGSSSLDYGLTAIEFTTIRIVSDNSWRVTAEYTPGWETVDYDDSAWGCATTPAPVNCGWENCWDDPGVWTLWSEDQYETIYLRKSFYIQDVSSVLSAAIATRCDDDHDLYLNGSLVASDWDGYAGPILKTDITAHLKTGANVLAVKASDTHGGCRHMCVDATIQFAATTPAWLTLEPEAGTIPANTSIAIQVTFDATVLHPGAHPATLNVLSNDPLNPMIAVPVTLTVNAPIQNLYLPVILDREPP